jgi:hypothetical protein
VKAVGVVAGTILVIRVESQIRVGLGVKMMLGARAIVVLVVAVVVMAVVVVAVVVVAVVVAVAKRYIYVVLSFLYLT